MLYMVVWTVLATGFTGHGSCIKRDLAQEWADEGNRVYAGEVAHKIVPCEVTARAK